MKSRLTTEQLRERAKAYRTVAAFAPNVFFSGRNKEEQKTTYVDSNNTLAEVYEELAQRREIEESHVQ